MAIDITKTWEYPHVNPDQSIDGKKGLAKALPLLYGPNYNSTNFDPLFSNIRTGALMSKPHHCTYNDNAGHKMTRRCVTEGHQGYCIEWVDTVIDGTTYHVRCGHRLKVESGGCGSHPPNAMADSKNLLIKNLIAGKLSSIGWDQLNSTERSNDDGESRAVPTAKQLIKAQEDQKLAELEEEQDTVPDLPADLAAYHTHLAFVEHQRVQNRLLAEERKEAAAAKRSGMLGKMKQAATDFKSIFSEEGENSLDQKLRQGKTYKAQRTSLKPGSDKFKNKRGGKKKDGSDATAL